jgi:hypothetical protein
MSEPTPQLKCTDDNYCTALNERIYAQEGRRVKGFLTGRIGLLPSMTLLDAPVFYGGHGNEPPLYLNFCPFCGHDFSVRLSRFEEAKAAARRDYEEGRKGRGQSSTKQGAVANSSG